MGQEKSRLLEDQRKPKPLSIKLGGDTDGNDAAHALVAQPPDDISALNLSQCERLGDPILSHVWRYDAKTVVKYSEFGPAAEVAALNLVRERTPIPVPKFIKYLQDDAGGSGYLFMEYIDGQPLDQAWLSCDRAQKKSIVSQLRGYLDELRQIKGQTICSADGSVCNDQIFANRAFAYGPYDSDVAFRAGIAKSLRSCDASPAFTETVIGFVNAMPSHDQIVFTHGDLVPRNILVRDGRVVAIVDWEMAGYYPAYWEYVKGHLFADYDHPWMEERVLDKLLEPYPIELGLLLHTPKIFMY